MPDGGAVRRRMIAAFHRKAEAPKGPDFYSYDTHHINSDLSSALSGSSFQWKEPYVTEIPSRCLIHAKHSGELATSGGHPLSGCAGLLHGKASHTILRSLPLPYSTAITDSQYFARHCVPPKYVRWCDSCSLATPIQGGRINSSTLPCGVMWHIGKHP